jgi:bifunctional non-homologous end joining protein LigD
MGGMPRLIKPMLASARRGLPDDDDRYGWEFKWDGVRAIAYVEGGTVRLLSRNDKEMAASYPELAVLAERVDAPVILDGEIVALREGRPDFAALQSRMHVRRPPGSLVRGTPVELYVFDLLYHGEQSLLALPYAERRERLAGLGLTENPVRTPPWYRGDARHVLAVSIAHGLEGVVGKPLTSAYHPGQRRDWIKVKSVRYAEVIICGWKPGEGRRENTIGSLLIGVYDEDRLRYAGHVGTGFTQRMLDDLMRRLEPLQRETSPFGTPVPAQHARAAHWVEPRLVGEVAYTEWTPDQVMRHPSWRGLRPDKAPAGVHRTAV